MRVYAWWPESYGEWGFVQAESAEAAKAALIKAKGDVPEGQWDKKYHDDQIDEWLKREPEIIEPGKVTFGEFA